MSPIVETIKKLHSKALSAEQVGSMEEAKIFAKKVQQLILKHKIDMSQIEFVNYDEEVIDSLKIRWSNYGHKDTSRACLWTRHLAIMVADYCNCRILMYRGSNGLIAYGRKTDLEVLEYMLQTMTPLCLKLGKAAYHELYWEVRPLEPWERKQKLGGYKISWKIGFVDGVREGVSSAQEEAEALAEAEGGGALVRLSGMLAKVDSFLSTRVTKKNSKQSTYRGNSDGYTSGKSTGKSVGSRTALNG